MQSSNISENSAENRYQLFVDLTLAITSSEDIDTALSIVLKRIVEATEWTAADAWFLDERTGKMKFRTMYAEIDETHFRPFMEVSQGMLFSKGEGLPGKSWQIKNTVWVTYIELEEDFPRKKEALDAGIRSGVAVPIPLNNEVIAVLCFYVDEVWEENKKFTELIVATAGQLGLLLKQKSAEQALRDSELRFRSLMESSNEAIIISRSSGDIIAANSPAEEIFGYSEEELNGKLLQVIIPEKYREAHRNGMARYATTREARVIGTTVELEGLRKDGTVFPLELSLASWEADELYFAGIMRDITDRKLAERELTRKNRDLERTNAELERFAYVASHDLKEPLRMISIYTDLLGRKYGHQLDDQA
nr:PAS domain S-box protein [Bacteroidota bacterium]